MRFENTDQTAQKKQKILDRQKAYRKVFVSKDAALKAVMADLKRFCRAENSCFDPDPRIHAVLEGRREVFLRIEQHLNYDPDALFEIYENGG